MKEFTGLRELILVEGLEDLIPLPEIALTAKAQGFLALDSGIADLSNALHDLVELGQIQVWRGHWSQDPEVVDRETAKSLLSREEQYQFNSSADLSSRVYYVNVDNLQVIVGGLGP